MTKKILFKCVLIFLKFNFQCISTNVKYSSLRKMNSRLWFLWRSLSVLIHITAVTLYGFALVFQFAYPWGYNYKQNDQELKFANSTAKPGEYSFGWKYKFLTYWNMVCFDCCCC